jgi:hypothetical protein
MTSTSLDLADASFSGAVSRAPAVILRLEGLGVLAAAVWAYAELVGDWRLFAVLFLVPDLSMLGYLAGRKVGAAAYNAGHSYLGPLALAAAGWTSGKPLLWSIALIWAAHIGFDRLLGYGLKYSTGFGDTHLGRKGRRRA